MTFSHHFWGMHLFWWLFWIIVVAAILMRGTWPSRRETPLETLRRRYAAGEISDEEYRHRLDVLTESDGSSTGSAA